MQSKKSPKKTATNVEKGTVAKPAEIAAVDNATSSRPAKSTNAKVSEATKPVSAAHKHKSAPAEKAMAAAASSSSFAAPVASQLQASVSHDDIAKLAHSYWLERGEHGSHEDDWFRAEQELLGL